MQIVINIPEKLNNRLRSFLGHGYTLRDEDVKIIADAIYNGQTEFEAFEWCTNCKELFDQIKWERDTAIGQLKELGYGLGEKIRTDKDAISRQAAVDYCYQLINVEHEQGSDEMNYGQERVNQTETILHHLEFMPSAQPERKKGKWLRYGYDGSPNDKDTVYWQCDQCLSTQMGRRETPMNYCPNCGAKMEV